MSTSESKSRGLRGSDIRKPIRNLKIVLEGNAIELIIKFQYL